MRARCALLASIAVIWSVASFVVARAQQHTTAEQYLFEDLNSARAAAGLPALAWNTALTGAAAGHAERMRKEGSLAHEFDGEPNLIERANASGIRFTVIAENVVLSDSAVEMNTSFMNSPDHRDNILDPRVNTVGISVREDHGELWVVEDFAKTSVELSFNDQEWQVAALLKAAGLKKVNLTQSARDTCRMTTGFAGERPAYVLRFTSADLSELPQQLTSRLAQGDIGEAAVGACAAKAVRRLSSYSIAVVLYR